MYTTFITDKSGTLNKLEFRSKFGIEKYLKQQPNRNEIEIMVMIGAILFGTKKYSAQRITWLGEIK